MAYIFSTHAMPFEGPLTAVGPAPSPVPGGEMTKRQEQEIRGLTARAELAERQITAYREWVACEEVRREKALVLEVEGTGLTVKVHGCRRAAGGVCLLYASNGLPCGEPVLLDDLHASWTSDPAPDIRLAARSLHRAREQALGSPQASPSTGGLDRMSEPEVRALLKELQDDVRAGVAQGSSEDIGDMVLKTLTDAGLDTSSLKEGEGP